MSCALPAMAGVHATDEGPDVREYWLTNFLSPYGDVHLERIRAHKAYVGSGPTLEQLSADADAWLTALGERVRSLALALCDPDPPPREVRRELVQVAAVACAWVAAIDRADVR